MGGLAYSQGRESERRYQSPHRHAEGAKSAVERACLNAKAPDVIQCIQESVEASEEQAHSEQDLSAQQRAATSALVAAIVGVVTLLVSGAGLWALLKTIDQGREALIRAAHANEIARDSARPHVIVSLGNFRPDPRITMHERVLFDIIASNVGGTGCVIEGVSGNWGTVADAPKILTGSAYCVIPLPAGESKAIEPMGLGKKDLIERPILRGMVRISGPFIEGDNGKLVRFAFRAFPEETFPRGAHYMRHPDMNWLNLPTMPSKG